MRQGLVSILMPLFNEEEFVGEALRRVIAASLPPGLSREIIVVDDGSTDGSASIVESMVAQHPDLVQLVRSDGNKGKGVAIRTAVDVAEGEYCRIQDADLEYSPQEYGQLLQPLVDGVADCGVRVAFRERGAPACALLLAHRRKPVLDHAVQHRV
jgi:glycosyltransferase involved in cell wall biosynthesis